MNTRQIALSIKPCTTDLATPKQRQRKWKETSKQYNLTLQTKGHSYKLSQHSRLLTYLHKILTLMEGGTIRPVN